MEFVGDNLGVGKLVLHEVLERVTEIDNRVFDGKSSTCPALFR
jgi:hypothetical protein